MAAVADVHSVARSVNADDLFVLRRVEERRFVHLGGVGRGEGWAGNIELLLDDDPIADRSMSEGSVERVSGEDGPRQVLGPYHSEEAAFVPVSDDLLVLFGAIAGPPSADDVLRAAASLAAESIDHVSPAKRLADELEILHAVRELRDGSHATLDRAARHVISVAATSLSCEAGILWLADSDVAWSSDEELLPASATIEALHDLRARNLPTCVQDNTREPLPPVFDHIGPVAYYALAVSGPVEGLLLLIHTTARPRGFTSLCQTLGLRLGEAAEDVLLAARDRERLEVEIERVNTLATTDAMTGLGNRLAWDQALAALRPDAPASIVVIDVDGLKVVNDSLGHDAGDDLIRAVGTLLLDAIRTHDVLARVGGDEFGILLHTGENAALVARIEAALAAHEEVHGVAVSISIGRASTLTATDPATLNARADADMYARKRGR